MKTVLLKIRLIILIGIAWFVWGGLAFALLRGNDVYYALLAFWVGLFIVIRVK